MVIIANLDTGYLSISSSTEDEILQGRAGMSQILLTILQICIKFLQNYLCFHRFAWKLWNIWLYFVWLSWCFTKILKGLPGIFLYGMKFSQVWLKFSQICLKIFQFLLGVLYKKILAPFSFLSRTIFFPLHTIQDRHFIFISEKLVNAQDGSLFLHRINIKIHFLKLAG